MDLSTDLPRLHPDDLALLANLIAERIGGTPAKSEPEPKGGWVDSKTVARELGVPLKYVRCNWRMLGGSPLHDHPKSRKVYDLAHARAVMEGRRPGVPEAQTDSRPQRRRKSSSRSRSLAAKPELTPSGIPLRPLKYA